MTYLLEGMNDRIISMGLQASFTINRFHGLLFLILYIDGSSIQCGIAKGEN